jgi:hypothetical protein
MITSKLSSRRLALLSGFALLAVVGASSVCDAESPWSRRLTSPSPPPPYRVELEAVDGSALPTFVQRGQGYVLGEPGARYNVRVTNPTSERVEVVVTVDGRDAISGSVGDYVTQRGYLIEPWGSVLIDGFRQSLDEVAAFRFTGRGRSYSALRGTPENVGVIGVAVFPEKVRPQPVRRRQPISAAPPTYDESYRNSYAPSAPAAPRAAESGAGAARDGYRGDDSPRKSEGSASGPSNIGTQYGESQRSSVVEVDFERRSKTHPVAVLRLRYDDYDGLQARGIDLSSVGYAYYGAPREPDPFPHSSRFAPPPR